MTAHKSFAPQQPRDPPVVFVLCPGSDAAAGGIGRFVTTLAESIPAFEPTLQLRVLDTRGSGSILRAPFYFVCALITITMAVFRRRLAVLHLNLASNGSALRKVICAALAWRLRIPFIVHLHGAEFNSFHRSMPKFARAVIRRMFVRAERVIVLGNYWRGFLLSEVGLASEKIEVIPNGVISPIKVHRADLIRPPHILFLGRLEARKGVTELLQALSSPAIAGLPWVATLAGDGDRTLYMAVARDLGLDSRISWPGWVDRVQVQALLENATMLVLPSHAEGLPMSVIEALAHGVAVVTTSVGAIPDYLLNGESAVIVPPGHPTMLAEAILTLLTDPLYRERLARRGHEIFLENFEITRGMQRWVCIYHDIIAGRPASARNVVAGV